MLGLHAAETGTRLPLAQKLVIGSPDHDCAPQWFALGYRIIANEDAASGQGTSVRLAAAQAIRSGARALCIILADMPFITGDHLGRLIATFEQSNGTRIIASARSGQAMPPAIFPADALEQLVALDGDSGARRLLANAELVGADDPILLDIDTETDLADANILLNNK